MLHFGCFAVLLLLCFHTNAQTQLVVYDGTTGTLGGGWMDWSWASHSLTSTDAVRSGDSYSASMVCAGWQGLFLSHGSPVDISSYSTFSFWINGGADPASVYLTVQLVSSVNSLTLSVADYTVAKQLPQSSWVQVLIPIASFGLDASNNNAITGFWFQGNGASGTPTVYFEDIAFVSQEVPPTSGPSLTVDASSKTPINPLIYGVTIWWTGYGPSDHALFEAFVRDVRLPMNRIGGDSTTRYNWEVDSSNAGADWYYVSGSGETNPTPGGMYHGMIGSNQPLGVATVVTIPMIQYITKSSEWGCSYRQSVYGDQQSFNPYLHPYGGDNCGNGITPSGANILDTDPLATDIPNTPEIQKAFVQHLTATYGSSATSNIYYQLDNEIYATAVKEADPTAKVAAPSEIQFAWYHDWGGQANVEYFLSNLKAHEQSTGQVIVDTFDVHYPDNDDGHWPVLNDMDRLRQTVDNTYPGKDISVSEWTMAGKGPLNGALAMADQFGKFAKNRVQWASIWGFSTADLTAPISYGLRIFRNYDGAGAGFGDQYLKSTTTDDSKLSVHAAIRSSDNALTILFINKDAAAQQSSLSLSNFQLGAGVTTAQVYQYSGANTGAIVSISSIPFFPTPLPSFPTPLPSFPLLAYAIILSYSLIKMYLPAINIDASGFSNTFAPYSLTLIIVQGTAVNPPVSVCVGPVSENQDLSLSCPLPSQLISSIQFASYGTPSGDCGSFAVVSSCHAATSADVLTANCLNHNSCSFNVNNGAFGDPCFGTYKHFSAQVTCSA